MSFSLSQSDNITDSPRPNAVLPFFPKYISNLYKYPEFDLKRNQNLKPTWLACFSYTGTSGFYTFELV